MSRTDNDDRVMCKYGTDCYQRNPEHHKKFKHPKRSLVDPCESSPKMSKLTSPEKNLASEEKIDTVKKNDETASRSDLNKSLDLKRLPSDIRERIELLFLVKMPEDFFSFYDFCKTLDQSKPHNALSAVGIELGGPFDLFEKQLKDFSKEEALRHHRYFFDPPEFQTVLVCNDKNQLHYGYFRDEPKENPVFVGSNEANKDCKIDIIGENLFSAVNCHIDKVKKTADPFKKIKIQKIQQALVEWSKKYDFSIDSLTKKMKDRRSKVVAKTFHGAGIVVPYDKKTQLGYRELKENDKNLKEILKHLCEAKSEDVRKIYWSKLNPVITFANIANDEFDFGTSLELGIDLFCFGEPILHKTILRILPTSYELLGRNEFATIIQAHLENRTKGNTNTITL